MTMLKSLKDSLIPKVEEIKNINQSIDQLEAQLPPSMKVK